MTDTAVVVVATEVPAGDRGTVGVATHSTTIKRMWHEATHVLTNIGDHSNPRKQAWVRKVASISLKRFARQLALSGDETAKAWLANKNGAMNEERSSANSMRANLERAATKASRHSNKAK